MRKAKLTRHTLCDEGYFGGYLSDSGFKCVTLERLPTGEYPCIPAGTYTCELRYSYKHKHRDFGFGYGIVYGVNNVPGRKDILVHPANWLFQIKGCIAPGKAVAQIRIPKGPLQTGVTSSSAATAGLMADMAGEPFELVIEEICTKPN